MKEFVSSVTERGRVTLPVEIRRLLGIRGGGKVIFRIEGGDVRLVPPKYTLETAFGAIEPLNRPENFEAVIRQAKDEHASDIVREMHEG